MKGIVDRFEGTKAVILLEEIKEELIVDREELPDGSDINTVVQVEDQDGEYRVIAKDDAQTDEQSGTTSDLMSKLRAKSKGSKFKKK
ncbi:DUF3006 domain-containing protein [Virgibacillus xinjiangensis]|uniref:DUF3006 domain-containing protein n=1 Tax=Virgibacillus xinjiangensis TaxID=393090 RepID=A0ABV7CZF6_9BACI